MKLVSVRVLVLGSYAAEPPTSPETSFSSTTRLLLVKVTPATETPYSTGVSALAMRPVVDTRPITTVRASINVSNLCFIFVSPS